MTDLFSTIISRYERYVKANLESNLLESEIMPRDAIDSILQLEWKLKDLPDQFLAEKLANSVIAQYPNARIEDKKAFKTALVTAWRRIPKDIAETVKEEITIQCAFVPTAAEIYSIAKPIIEKAQQMVACAKAHQKILKERRQKYAQDSADKEDRALMRHKPNHFARWVAGRVRYNTGMKGEKIALSAKDWFELNPTDEHDESFISHSRILELTNKLLDCEIKDVQEFCGDYAIQ